jgi:Thiamine pyrophosphate enzyme, C-terminal TPP binding domain
MVPVASNPCAPSAEPASSVDRPRIFPAMAEAWRQPRKRLLDAFRPELDANRVRSRLRHFRDLPHQDHQQARGRGRVVRDGRWDGGGLMLRHIDTGGKRRTFASLLHGTMANRMPSALGLQKCQPGRQVICLAGDGGFTMLLGDLPTTVQEKLPIKIVVYDNGKLGFVDIEQKAAGLVPVYTDLKSPDFGESGEGDRSLGAQRVEGRRTRGVHPDLARAARSSAAAREGETDQLVTPPSPLVSPEAVVGMAVYTASRNAARQGARRLGNAGGEHSLITSDEHKATSGAASVSIVSWPQTSQTARQQPIAGKQHCDLTCRRHARFSSTRSREAWSYRR